MPNLLVIDDESLILDLFRFMFSPDEVTVRTARSAREGREIFASQWADVVLLDVRLPDASGLDLLRELRQINAKVPTILMTGHGSASTAIEAMRLGAADYVLKPFEPDALIAILQRAFEARRLMAIPAIVPEQHPDVSDTTADVLVGHCSAMQEIYRAIGRVAVRDVTTLILGESGTGKEVVARAIYHYSRRADGPFLAVNCAAIPETLLESELFGHESGTFTGADRKRIGKFEQCHGGTIFLDEIGDMPPAMQAKILRILQEQTFERLGGNTTIRTDVRIIAATNRDLEKMIESQQFRRDLFYRLNTFTITLPPLRERGDDLKLLIDHFLRRFAREFEKELSGVSPEALQLLYEYSWPGNVRELQSVLKHAAILATSPFITANSLPALVRSDATDPSKSSVAPRVGEDIAALTREKLAAGETDLYNQVITVAERMLLTEVLHHTKGNLSHAARLLGINRATLRAKLANCGIQFERTMLIDEKE